MEPTGVSISPVIHGSLGLPQQDTFDEFTEHAFDEQQHDVFSQQQDSLIHNTSL